MAFGFDPSLILGARNAPEPTPNETLRTLAELAQMRGQQAQQQATLADLARRQQRETALQRIYQQNAQTPDAVPEALMGAGYGDEGLKWLTEQALAKSRERQGLPQQLSPAEEQARLARAEYEREKARQLATGGGGKQMDPDVRDNLRARTEAIRKKTKGGGGPTGPNKLLTLEGYELSPDFDLKPQDAEKLRSAQADTHSLENGLDELMGLYRQYGNKVLPSQARARMESLARHIQLKAKGPAVFGLGVIAGPDMQLLDSVVPVPTSKQATMADFFSGSGGDASETMERLKVMREQIGKNFDEAARARGYRRKAAQKAAAKGGLSAQEQAEMEALAKELGETP